MLEKVIFLFERKKIAISSHYLHLIFTLAALVAPFKWSWILFSEIILVFFFYRFYLKTLERLYYTFWSFSFTLAVYLIAHLIAAEFESLPFYLFFAALCLLGLELRMMNSPLYYPRVRWWEYDFRYRGDLKIKVLFEGKEISGRLVDLRRRAGSVVCFREFKVNQVVRVLLHYNEQDFDFPATIKTKREYSLGRGFNYGVLFQVRKEQRKSYRQFMRLKRRNRLIRMRSKFKEATLES